MITDPRNHSTRKAMMLILALICLFPLSSALGADKEEHGVPDKLVVGVMHFPPFAMKKPSGGWEGLGFDLLQRVATDMGAELELKEFTSVGEIKNAVESGAVDLAPVTTMTESLERLLDFSNPYFRSGSAIAVKLEGGGSSVFSFDNPFFSLSFLKVVGVLVLLWLIAGSMVLLFERRKYPGMSDKRTINSLGSGIWWAAVTMTTVGYGDKTPRTAGGRIVAIVWMFSSIILISGFTATITTWLTVDELRGEVRGLSSLPTVRSGSLAESQSLEYLVKNGFPARPFESVEAGLSALIENNIDAFVYDEAILKHLVRTKYPARLYTLAETFNHYYIAMALPPGSTLREPLNRALLRAMKEEEWNGLVDRYFGAGSR